MAPLTSFLIDEYSIRGALLLLAGLWLNICVVGALLRPINTYHESNPSGTNENEDVDENDENVPSTTGNCDIEIKVIPCETNEHTSNDMNEESAERMKVNAEENVDERKISSRQQKRMVQSKSEHSHLVTTVQIENLKRMASQERSIKKVHVSNPIIAALKAESRAFVKSPLTSSLPNGLHMQHPKEETAPQDNKARSLFGSNMSITSLLYRGDSIYDLNSVVSRTNTALDKDLTQDTLDEPKSTYLQFLFSPLLMRDLFILGCGYYAYYTPIVSFPAYGDEMGINKFEIAWTVGLIGKAQQCIRCRNNEIIRLQIHSVSHII